MVPRLRFLPVLLPSLCGEGAAEEVSLRRLRDGEEGAAVLSCGCGRVAWGGGAVDVRAEGWEAGGERACGPAVVTGECGDEPSFSSSKAGGRVVGEGKRPRAVCALTASEGHRTFVADAGSRTRPARFVLIARWMLA